MAEADVWVLVAENIETLRVGTCTAIHFLEREDVIDNQEARLMMTRLHRYTDGDWECCAAPGPDLVLSALWLGAEAASE